MAKRKRAAFKIDIRDQRLPGGRFSASARTTSAPEFRRREAAVRSLIEAGALDIIQRITARGVERLHLADVAAAVQRGDLDSLRAARSAPLTIGATADRLRQRKEATRRKKTQLQVEITLTQLEEHFGVRRAADGSITHDVELGGIGTKECEGFLHGPKDEGEPWAPRTQGVKYAYAKQLWQIAIDDEAEAAERENRKPRLRRNPWANVEPAEIVPTRVIFLTAEERDAMLAVLEDTPLHAYMAVAYHAGLRLGEAIHLRTDIDVDLSDGVLRIQSRPGQWAWMPKTNRGQRDVPINRTLRGILDAHVSNGYAGNRFFFHAPRWDRPLGSGTAYEWWVDAYKAAGLKHGRSDADAVTYHSGRHTFCSLLVQQGVSPLIVAELVGDKYEEVIRTYGHLTPHNLADAVKLLESTQYPTNRPTIKKAI